MTVRRLAVGLAHSKRRGFGVAIVIFVVLLAGAAATSWMAVKVVDGARAYASAEGRYSSAQKIAVLHLHRYAHSGIRGDYDGFLAAMAVPLGDRAARLAMERVPVDPQAAIAGILQGQNDPDDTAGLILLFRTFSWWSPFATAVADWRDGDRLIEALVERGAAMKALVETGALTPELRKAKLREIDDIDDQLTALESSFSRQVGVAARHATRLVILGLSATVLLLWVIGMLSAIWLFRQQRALYRQLGASEQRFRDYTEVASDWYWEMNGELRLTYLSERFFAVTAASPEEVIGRNLADFIDEYPDDVDLDENLAALAERQPIRDLRLSYRKADDEVRYLSFSAKPNFDPNGVLLGYRGVGSDITSMVEDAQMLREAKERAEAANRAKSEFLANMSHELRTPLNAIIGFSEIIMDRLFGPGTVDRHESYARDIHNSGRLLLSIIDEILDLSKIEAGREELFEEEVGLDEIVSETRQLFAERFEQAGLHLQIELPNPAPRLFLDARKFKQCLANLLSNGLKFTPIGGTVAVSAEFLGNGDLAITVRDTGIGIAPADLDTVLTPFGQVETAFSRAHQGTGLGLPITKALIELHGGTLTITSVLGTGTTVSLILPRERLIDLARDRSAPPEITTTAPEATERRVG